MTVNELVVCVCVCVVSDESLLGGLSLLLMAGQHITASPLFTAPAAADDDDDTKSNTLLRNSATVSQANAPPSRVSSAVSFVWYCSFSSFD